ncbi:hypothetical protein [Bradyrhizobium sp. 33ap4]|uniref:hypothetical protein n=1 Tax=Bradyrhizobium sp. 33ap4 TaxID=3061630 RepID=UPI002931154B|nr:hypothetical protein [Bradyrhizobium sp. 33ap4]
MIHYLVVAPGHIAQFAIYEQAVAFAKDFAGVVLNMSGLLPPQRRPLMFYRRDLGTFMSMRPDDLSDLAGEWLVAAVENFRAKGREAPRAALDRLPK